VEAKKPNRQKRRGRKATRGKSNAAPQTPWKTGGGVNRGGKWGAARTSARYRQHLPEARRRRGSSSTAIEVAGDRGHSALECGARHKSKWRAKAPPLRHHHHDAARVRAPGPAHTRNLPGSHHLQRDGYLDFAGYRLILPGLLPELSYTCTVL
jgi:hypothetical protein